MSSSFLQYLCRFCAKPQTLQNVIDLRNSGSSPHRSVRDMLCIFSEEIIDFSNSKLSAIICNDCFSSLTMCYNFFVQVRQSQLILSRAGYGTEDELDIGPLKEENEILGHDDTIEVDVKPFIPELSWSSYEWGCRHCSAIFPSLPDLREHGLKTHGTCFVFRCRDCDETPVGFEEFIDHVREHHPHLKNYCQYCNMKMNTPTHVDDTHNNFYCTYCGQEFANIILLQAHVHKNINMTNECTNMPTETSHITIDKTVTTYSEELQITPDIDIIKDEPQENYRSVKVEISDNDENNIKIVSLENIDETNDSRYELSLDNSKMSMNVNENCNEIDPMQQIKTESNGIEIESWCDYPFVCKFCGIAVESENTLILHCRYTHKKSFARKCVDCEDTSYTTLESFVRHVGEHRPHLLATETEVVADINKQQTQQQLQQNIHLTQIRPYSNAERQKRYREKRKAYKMNACTTSSLSGDVQLKQEKHHVQINKSQPQSNDERQRKYRKPTHKQKQLQMEEFNEITELSNEPHTSSIHQLKKGDQAEHARKRHLNKQRQSRFRARQRIEWANISTRQRSTERTTYNHSSADQPDERMDLTDLPQPSRSDILSREEDSASMSPTPVAYPPVKGPRSKAQRQRDYRQRLAANRTHAQMIAARKADTERKRRQREAARLALRGSSRPRGRSKAQTATQRQLKRLQTLAETEQITVHVHPDTSVEIEIEPLSAHLYPEV